MRVTGSSLMMSAVLAVLAFGVAGAADDAASFAGVKSCAMCHKKADGGDQYGKWTASPHAGAYAALAKDDAKAAGAKLLFCTHHEPTRSDDALETVFAAALEEHTELAAGLDVRLAREGDVYAF